MHAENNKQGVTDCVKIQASVATCLNYASWQNSVPILRCLKIDNREGETLENLCLEVRSIPGFARPKKWIIDHIGAGSGVAIRDRNIELDPDYLNGLNEAERGVIEFTLSVDGDIITTASHDVRVLARDQWGGLNSSRELLAAFVMPNDPAVSKILKVAGDVLSQHEHSSALDGYQSGDPRRAYMLVAAIWSAVAAKSLTYATPPCSFETEGQKTRRPSTILSEGLATCLDTTLLFAAAIEAVGLNPVIVLVHGHCFVGAWLVEKTMDQVVETDCSEIRKAIAARELITFETTLITHRPPAPFEDAIQAAVSSTGESNEDNYLATIDITRARMAQIRPLASHESIATMDEDTAHPSGPLPLPAAPTITAPMQSAEDTKPATPEGRIDRWQRKLLDLSLRNRLLNFKDSKQSVPIHCPNISLLEDHLAAGKQLRLISLSEHNPLSGRDAEIHRSKSKQDLDSEFAIQALDRAEVSCSLSESELAGRLTTIYRNVRNDLAEGGSNTLFLAVGFLRWKKPEDTKFYRAPLLLVPVKLIRKSAVSSFKLAMHEDDVRFNATLIQLLKKDFARDLSFFESNLPTDESGVDVPQILERMRREVREIPGFEVVDETALGTFSFAKYLMWKDLIERIDTLKNNRVVRHLIDSPDRPFESQGGSIPQALEVDIRYDPNEIYHPLPADSSQLAAVMAASEGQDFVLIGPPGTGKSQTIANMISQCLATGKTVLFVAEKTAALNVVYRRLRAHGLGDCCLELHSNKAERRKFLDQLDSAWKDNRQVSQNDWISVSSRLKVRRDELNSYVAAIHKEYSNGWTVFEAMGTCVKGGDHTTPEFDWEDSVQHDRAAFQKLSDIIDQIALTYGAIEEGTALPAVDATRWSASWEQALLSQCASLQRAADELRETLSRFCDCIGIPGRNDVSLAEMEGIGQLAESLLDAADEDVQLLFHKQFTKFPDAHRQLDLAITAYAQARNSAAANYDESLDTIPLDEIDQNWRHAIASVWPLSWFAKRKVTRLLQTYANEGIANPDTDIVAIRSIQAQLEIINASPLAGPSTHYNATETDIRQLDSQLTKAAAVRRSLVAVGKQMDSLQVISNAVGPFINGQHPDAPLFATAKQYSTAMGVFLDAMKTFGDTAGKMPITKATSQIVRASEDAAMQIQANRTSLRRWTAWCEVRRAAQVAGLSRFVESIEQGDIASNELADRFRLAYARWWVRGVIDRDDILRTFQRFQHEDAIEDFCQLDEQARSLASLQAKQSIAHDLPLPEGVPRRSELGLLRHQIGLQRPSKSIREVIAAMPESFGKLAPCLLMSPLSIAQYLPVHQTLFDVVIFDEASQITTWDAVGAIARGRQTIIVGDPKQLPPTNFFGRADDDHTNEGIEDHEKDLESILDEAKASGLPTLQLNWHYRSRHESLIAFSNWNYYGNNLVTFPAAESEDRGVSFVHLPDAMYDRGKSRTNRKEAEAIVAEAVARMNRNLLLPIDERLTFGVITFNSQQQSLIQDLFDQALRDNPELDWYFADERTEPTVVKNLENVQGDERDVMMFSITYGRKVKGETVPRSFGALNRDGGERRLNVAVTRARQELLVFSSFTADELSILGTNSRGVRDLKAFLEYAEKGPEAIAARSEGSGGGFDSPFEEAVAESLQSLGWQVVPQVGVSGFRVDLGVIHPDKPGAYLAGVECDGATYHRSAVARDRDKIRQQVLENLGWNIVRIWSPEWWYDAKSATETVHRQLQQLLDDQRNDVPLDTEKLDTVDPNITEPDTSFSAIESASGIESEHDIDLAPKGLTVDKSNERFHGDPQMFYARVKLSDLASNQDRFFESSYDDELRAMAVAILNQQAPIRDDVLAKQVARAHGFARTGANIRSRVLNLLVGVPSTKETTGRFLWSSETPSRIICFRNASCEDDRRSVGEMPIAELLGLIQRNEHLLSEDDPAIALARSIGLGRLSQSARQRFEEAVSRWQELKGKDELC
tara:strand:+ start:2613 stop:8513 length:5901 start_codon:yes stop_codon:yes gene_type:complete